MLNMAEKCESPSIVITSGTIDDVPKIWEVFQKHFEHDGTVGVSSLNADLVRRSIGSWRDTNKYFEVLMAKDASSGELVATCLYQKKFSFYRGRIVWMDQLFVKDTFRGKKIGLRLVHKLAQIAKDEEAFIMWDCLEWNVNSIKFYESLGANVMSEIKLVDPTEVKILGFELKPAAMEKLLERKLE